MPSTRISRRWEPTGDSEALAALATTAASELSAKAHRISRCPLCLEIVTAKSPCVGSFLISRTSNRCADCALKMLSFRKNLGGLRPVRKAPESEPAGHSKSPSTSCHPLAPIASIRVLDVSPRCAHPAVNPSSDWRAGGRAGNEANRHHWQRSAGEIGPPTQRNFYRLAGCGTGPPLARRQSQAGRTNRDLGAGHHSSKTYKTGADRLHYDGLTARAKALVAHSESRVICPALNSSANRFASPSA